MSRGFVRGFLTRTWCNGIRHVIVQDVLGSSETSFEVQKKIVSNTKDDWVEYRLVDEFIRLGIHCVLRISAMWLYMHYTWDSDSRAHRRDSEQWVGFVQLCTCSQPAKNRFVQYPGRMRYPWYSNNSITGLAVRFVLVKFFLVKFESAQEDTDVIRVPELIYQQPVRK